MDGIKKLKIIRGVCLAIVICPILFIGWAYQYIVAIIAMSISIILDRKFYRCHHCSSHLDVRMHLEDGIHCPYCGNNLSLPKDYREKSNI